MTHTLLKFQKKLDDFRWEAPVHLERMTAFLRKKDNLQAVVFSVVDTQNYTPNNIEQFFDALAGHQKLEQLSLWNLHTQEPKLWQLMGKGLTRTSLKECCLSMKTLSPICAERFFAQLAEHNDLKRLVLFMQEGNAQDIRDWAQRCCPHIDVSVEGAL